MFEQVKGRSKGTQRGARARVVIAGMGDTGLLTAVALTRRHRLVEVVGISSKPGLLSGKDVGWRLARPGPWAALNNIAYARYRALDRARLVHGSLVGLDPDAREVTVRSADGRTTRQPYDVLVIATGVRNGFWRRPELQDQAEIDNDLRESHARVAAARSIAVVGGGAAAVSSAAQLAAAFPRTRVDLYFPHGEALRSHHPRVWTRARARLERLGVRLHPWHVAEVPADLSPGPGPVLFTSGQPPAEADVVLWAIGRVEPNTGWLPGSLLDPQGFVRVEADLRVSGQDDIWAVGDVAASDPLRSSARNQGAALVAGNIVATLRGRPTRPLRVAGYAQGSVMGPLPDGLEVFTAAGHRFRLPLRLYAALERHLVARFVYRGIRPPTLADQPADSCAATD